MLSITLCSLLAVAQHPSDAGTAQEADGPELIIREASGEGTEALARIQPAPGLEVTLFAEEPMVVNPVSLYIANDGAIYVTETFRSESGVTDMRSHMDWLDYELSNTTVSDRVEMHRHFEGEDSMIFAGEPERIRLLRDTDSDGVADQSTVFSDHCNKAPDGIGAGVLVRGNDVYFTCIPTLWKLSDTDADDRADTFEALATGFGVHIALRGHDLHGLRFGPDGRLYFSMGDRGLNLTTQEGRHLYLPHTGAVLRCEADGSDLELFSTGLRNPQELVFDDHGNLFTGDNNSDGGDRARWVYIVQHGDTGWRMHYQYLTSPYTRGPWNNEKLWHPHHAGQAAYIVPPIANFINGPSGLTYYPGTGLTSAYDGHFFLCEFRGDAVHSGVYAFDQIPQGASFAMGEAEKFLWGNLPTDIEFGPDGSMYVTDWIHGWNKQGKGRIFRVSSTADEGLPLRAEVQRLLAEGLGGRGTLELMELLAHRDRRIRQEAQFALADLGVEGLRGFVKVLRQSEQRIDRLHAIWGIGQVERKLHVGAAEFLRPFLEDPDVELRANAARVLGDLKHIDAAPSLIEALADDSLRVRHLAALALGELGWPDSVPALVQSLEEIGAADPVLRHSLVMGLLGCASDETLAELCEHESIHVQMAVLLCYRRKSAPEIARFLSSEDPLLFAEACRAVYDVPITAALPSLAAQISRADIPNTACARRILAANHRLGGTHRALELARLAAEDHHQDKFRIEALQLLSDWVEAPGPDRVHGAWWPVESHDAADLPLACAKLLEARILSAPDKIATAYLALAESTNHAPSAPSIAALVADTSRKGRLRARALSSLQSLGADELRSSVDLALQSTDSKLRAAGLKHMHELDPAVALARAEALVTSGFSAGDTASETDAAAGTAADSADTAANSTAEYRAAYTILGALDHPRATELLTAALDRLSSGDHPAASALELVRAAESKNNEALNATLARRQSAETDAALARWIDSLEGGDPERGEKIFLDYAELSCLRCHRTEETAEPAVGPTLTNLSERLTRRDLLISLVDPNRTIAESYESWTLLLTDDTVLAGRILSEDETNLVLINSDGEVYDVAPAEIAERKRGLSSMPEGLAGFLTRAEMRDLIEYLATL